MSPTIRVATEKDAAPIQKIYAPFVDNTVISFELTPPDVAEMQQRMIDTSMLYPWLVCEHQKDILGYAYAGAHRTRAAYQWSVDVSVYVHERARRSGVGRALYQSLFKILTLQGFSNAFAGIALPNAASIGLHESMGFQPIGVYRSVGYKLGKWHDVGWWQLVLQQHRIPPESIIPMNQIKTFEEFTEENQSWSNI